MQRSDCVFINRHTASECLMDKELFDREVPDEYDALSTIIKEEWCP